MIVDLFLILINSAIILLLFFLWSCLKINIKERSIMLRTLVRLKMNRSSLNKLMLKPICITKCIFPLQMAIKTVPAKPIHFIVSTRQQITLDRIEKICNVIAAQCNNNTQFKAERKAVMYTSFILKP